MTASELGDFEKFTKSPNFTEILQNFSLVHKQNPSNVQFNFHTNFTKQNNNQGVVKRAVI